VASYVDASLGSRAGEEGLLVGMWPIGGQRLVWIRGRCAAGARERGARGLARLGTLRHAAGGRRTRGVVDGGDSSARHVTDTSDGGGVSAFRFALLQNIIYVINPRGATVFPKGHTSWDTPLHLYISVMICGMQTTVLSFVSLNLITTEYTLYFNTLSAPLFSTERLPDFLIAA
jgi:hypothetical protein